MRKSIVVVLILSALVASACTGTTSGTAPVTATASTASPEKAEITIGEAGTGGITTMPMHLADVLGYYKEEGVNVKFVAFGAATVATTAVAAGTVDYTTAVVPSVITINNQGGRLVQTVLMIQAPGIVLLVNNTVKGAKSIKDIAGLNIGVTSLGSGVDLFVRSLFARSGLDPASAKAVAVGLGTSAIAALTNDKVQALGTVDPFATQLTQSGKATILVDGRTIAGATAAYGGRFPGAGLVTTQRFVRENPRTAAALSRAVARALQYLQSHTAEEVAALLPASLYYPDGDRALFAQIVRNNAESFRHNGTTGRDIADISLATLKAANPKTDYSGVDLSATYDDSWAGK